MSKTGKNKRISWKGETGLKKAKEELVKFAKLNNRIPKINDGFGSLATIASRREWKDYNVNTWKDLLRYAGFEVKDNKKPEKKVYIYYL